MSAVSRRWRLPRRAEEAGGERPGRRGINAGAGVDRQREGERNIWILVRAARYRMGTRARPQGSSPQSLHPGPRSRHWPRWLGPCSLRSAAMPYAVFRHRPGSVPLYSRARRAQADRRARRQGLRGVLRLLSRAGFRRSHRFAYRPACRGCASCVPVRSRSTASARPARPARVQRQSRALRRAACPAGHNRAVPPVLAYQRSRHRDSEMATMNYGDYREMIEDTAVQTGVAEFRDRTDVLVAARWSIGSMTGFRPFTAIRSGRPPGGLGIWTSCGWSSNAGARASLTFISAYWISESPKMAYKAAIPGAGTARPQANGCRLTGSEAITVKPSFRGAGVAREPGIQPQFRSLGRWIRAPPFGRPRNDGPGVTGRGKRNCSYYVYLSLPVERTVHCTSVSPTTSCGGFTSISRSSSRALASRYGVSIASVWFEFHDRPDIGDRARKGHARNGDPRVWEIRR